MITRLTSFARAWLLIVWALVLGLPDGAAQVGLRDPVTVAGTRSQAAAPGYTYYATTFNGSSNYMTKALDLTANADGKAGTLSVWVLINGGNAANQVILDTEFGVFRLLRNSSNKLQVIGKNAGETTILNISSAGSYTASATWLWILAAWDLAANVAYLYVNDADVSSSVTKTNDTIDYTRPNWAIGSNNGGGQVVNMCLCELWWKNSYIDPTNSSNRRLFSSAWPNGKPVSLGADGSLPGVTPLLYFNNPFGTFQTNKGTGGGDVGNDWLVNGALATCTAP